MSSETTCHEKTAPLSEGTHVDVLVCGGGTAGIPAAIQSARAGAKTMLVEKTGMMGGTTTHGGVNFPGLFHAWGRQVIAGIGWELVSDCISETGGSLPDFTDCRRRHWHLQIRVNRFVYAALGEEKLRQAGVGILLHTMIAAVTPLPDTRCWRVMLCTKTGIRHITARVIIDCTGDANIAAMAGLPLRISEQIQPATLSCFAKGYDPNRLDIEAINRALDAEVNAGRLDYTDVSWDAHGPNVEAWLRKHGVNANHIHGRNARTSEGKTELELDARRRLLQLYRFLRQQPGLEHLVIEQVAAECGVRETATIKGRQTVTGKDYLTGRRWEDAVCYSFYPIDLHTAEKSGLTCEPLGEGVVPTVPAGALIPSEASRFLVAGRCISSDRLANSALRVQATCMATGQAAGAMAALGASRRKDPGDVPIREVRALLRQHQAIIP
jgi:hypothetical protein